MTPWEASYRRWLRLLPAGFRSNWEEDMVSAYMERASEKASPRSTPLWSERRAVLALAVRTRLNGSHAAPRGRIVYHAIHGFALLTLLYQAVTATLLAVGTIPAVVLDGYRDALGLVHDAAGLPFVVAFVAYAFDKVTTARLAAVLGLVTVVAADAWQYNVNGINGGPVFWAWELLPEAWLVACVAAVFVRPLDVRSVPGRWIGVYLLTCLVVVAMRPIPGPDGDRYSPPFDAANDWFFWPDGAAPIALILAALIALVAAARSSAAWLLAVAALGLWVGGWYAMNVTRIRQDGWASWRELLPFSVLSPTLLVLSVCCAAVGLVKLLGTSTPSKAS
jgi:hypothetical protein